MAFESASQKIAEIGIHPGEQARFGFEHGDLAAERGKDARKLAADVAAAEDEQARRQLGERQQIVAIQNARAIAQGDWQFRGARTGGEDNGARVGERVGDVAFAIGHFNLGGAFQSTAAFDEIHAVFIDEILDARCELGHHLLPSLHNAGQLRLGLGNAHSPLAGLLCLAQQIHAGDHRFGGDAAGVQAHAAGRIGVYQRHPQPVMRRANGGHIPTGASADDGEVIMRITHARNLTTKWPEANKEFFGWGLNRQGAKMPRD